MLNLILTENNNFITWSIEHGLVVGLFILIGITLIRWGKQTVSEDKKWQLLYYQGIVLSATVIVWTIVQFFNGNFNYKEDLPFLICNFMALTFPIFVTTRSRFIFDVIYFWILVATVQAIITPDLKNSFPHYHFIKFWIVHCGLVVALLYSILVLGFRPYWKSMFTSFLVLEAYIIIIFGINYLLDANYMFLNQKPDFPTALDALGDYPTYLIKAHLIVFPVFLLFYSPFVLKDFLAKKNLERG